MEIRKTLKVSSMSGINRKVLNAKRKAPTIFFKVGNRSKVLVESVTYMIAIKLIRNVIMTESMMLSMIKGK